MKIASSEDFASQAAEFQSRLIESAKVLQKLRPVEVGMSAKDAVFHQDGLTLYRYRPLGRNPPRQEPVLIVYALVNRPCIVDLYEKRSLVRGLLGEGLDVYLIDWGYPTQADRYVDLHHYIDDKINVCVDQVLERAHVDRLNLLGICQGGTLSLCYSALYPQKINALVTMVTPVDFHTSDNLLTHWFSQIDVDTLVDTLGNVPGSLLNSMFLSLRPFRLNVEKYLDFANILDDKDKLENFLRMEKWIFDSPDQAGAMFATFVKHFFRDNLLVTGGLEIGGRAVDLKTLRLPVLNIMAARDHLVPPASSKALKYLAGIQDYTELEYDTGHIGIYVSAKAGLDIPVQIGDWMQARKQL